MKRLNLPTFTFRYKEEGVKKYIWDEIREKYVVLTPEEWVRQNFLRFMSGHLNYPASLTGVEKMLKINGLSQRCDIVLYNRKGKPVLIVECKAPSVSIGNTTLNQAARYNTRLRVPYLVLTNGLQHYCIRTESDEANLSAEKQFPDFNDLDKF